MNLTFVRHAESIGNLFSADQRAAHAEPNHAYTLSEAGKLQADLVGEFFVNTGTVFDACLHSTFFRTKETLERIRNQLQSRTPVFEDSRLDEKWDGIFHELSRADIELLYPEQVRLRERAGYYHYRAPGGESCPDVEIRIRSFLLDVEGKYNNKSLLVVGHGNWFLLFQKVAHSLSVSEFLALRERGCKNCSVTTYTTLAQEMPTSFVPWQGKVPENRTSFA